MHINAYINLSTFLLCLSCGRSLDFLLASECIQSRDLKLHSYCAQTRTPRFFLNYSRTLILLITRYLFILGFYCPAQVKRRRIIWLFANKLNSLVPRVIQLRKWHYSLLFPQIPKTRSWLIRKKPESGRDLNTSREYRTNYYPEVRPGIESRQWRPLLSNQSLRRTHCKHRSMRTQLFPSPLKQFFKTLSLRRFAYEFAQHKEVPGDQLKPSKERIKNVNISNQQRRC